MQYSSMWAYGNHYRCDDEVGYSHVSYDSGVGAIISQLCRSSKVDRCPVEAGLNYVGFVKSIIQVKYGHIRRTLLKCLWIIPNLHGSPTIQIDKHGFWSVKFNARQIPEVEPYIYLHQVQQVYFVDDIRDPEWKVVIQKEPRAKRVVTEGTGQWMGAPGNADAVYDMINDYKTLGPHECRPVPEGESVPDVDVHHFDAHMELENDEGQYEDMDFIDDDDDDDVPHGRTGPDDPSQVIPTESTVSLNICRMLKEYM